MKKIQKILLGITAMALVGCGGSTEKSNDKSSLTIMLNLMALLQFINN